MGLRNILFGSEGGLMNSELRAMTRRNKLSDYLPHMAYDPETSTYINTDQSIGFIWECIPLVYAGKQTFEILEGIFNMGLPAGTVLQFTLYADPYILPYTHLYKLLKTRQSKLMNTVADRTIEFYNKGSYKGFEKLQGIPARNFRLFVSLKLHTPVEQATALDLRNNIGEILAGAHLCPGLLPPHGLIEMLMKLFNDNPPETDSYYDETVPIRKQIILSETPVVSGWDTIQVGKRYFKCLTVKKMAQFVDCLTFNYVSGDIWGVQSDASQINNPFFLTVNVIFDKLKTQLHGKCNFVLQQHGVGSLAPSLKRKQEEYMWATDEIEKGTEFVRIMPILWHMTPSESQSLEATARIKRIWESRGFIMQEDKGILSVLLLSALPFGMYNVQKNADFIDRDFICHPKVAAKCFPVPADIRGGGNPHIMLMGRKGQLVCLDIFDKRANNQNALVCAGTGYGKSFLVNYIVFNYYASGAIMRIIDIGGSYRKLCNIVGGKFVNFRKDANICLNPFTFVRDINDEIGVLSAIVAQMAYSGTGDLPNETEMTLIKNAIRLVYSEYGNDASIDSVYKALASPNKSSDEIMELECGGDNRCISNLLSVSANLAFNLRSFTSQGQYGKWFNGPATLNIEEDDFVVLELEELKPQKDLLNVITLQILNYVTANLYLSDRSQKRLIIFDEAWQFFKESSLLKDVIEEGYRRARKYGGSFTTITQSLLDFESFGQVGSVIMSNSAFKFLLESPDFEKARNKKLIDYDEFTMKILKSVRTPRPRYSEIFMDTPMGTGVARLIVDPYSYYLYTSDAGENTEIEQLVKSGKTYSEALSVMVENAERQAP
jgi:conjugal transfer ATP-binding protein TraC